MVNDKIGMLARRSAAGVGAVAFWTLAAAGSALAQEEVPTVDSGDTAWMITATALVLMMTIPGLALFYGGMVRKKNVVAMTAQNFALAALMSVVWMVIGYSLAFGDGGAIADRAAIGYKSDAYTIRECANGIIAESCRDDGDEAPRARALINV